jgi:hypothetical protein
MNTGSSATQLVNYSFLVVFANDKTIDEKELGMLSRLTLADGEVDDRERKVLRNIFSRVSRETVEENVWQEIVSFRKKYDI